MTTEETSFETGTTAPTGTEPQPRGVGTAPSEPAALKDNEFRLSQVLPGTALLVGQAAVFNVAGKLCATQADCTHRGGPLNEGTLDGSTLTCPWHGAQFDVCTGALLRGPAREPLQTYRVVVDGDIGRVEGIDAEE